MFPRIRGTRAMKLLLACLLFAVGSGLGANETDDGLQLPPRPFKRPPLPQRPTRPPNPRLPARPGQAASSQPQYALEVVGSKHVAGVYRSEVHTTDVAATEWIVYFPVAQELSCQTEVETTMEPAAERIQESSRQHRPILRARIADAEASPPQRVSLAVRYEATLLARRLVPVGSNQRVTPVPPLNFQERFVMLAATPTLDFRTAAFQIWLDNNKLRREKEEGDVDFARRVFQAMREQYTYKDGLAPQPVSILCDLSQLDCDTLSLVFAAAMRANSIPARVLYGWPSKNVKPNAAGLVEGHTKNEFFAEGVGWIPVDLAYAMTDREHATKYFGEDQGNFLIAEVDPDYILPHPNFLERVASIHPGPASWAKSQEKKPDVTIKALSWQIEE